MLEEKKLLKRRKKAERENNETELAAVCTNLASLYMENAQYEAAIDEYTTVANIYKKQNQQIEFGTANRGIGEAYLELSKFKEAVKYFEIYLDACKKNQDKLELQRAYASLGHTYLTQHLINPSENSKTNLHLANKFFQKSLNICLNLVNNEISKFEHADMKARLYLNFGLVQDSLGHVEKAEEYFNKSINICKGNDIYEQLQRSYVAYAALFEKRGEHDLALRQYNLAVETAEKLKDKPIMLATSLLSQSEILVKLSHFEDARNALLRAYKLNIPHETEANQIRTNLKTAQSMLNAHQQLLTTPETAFISLKKWYEKLGDGACHFKAYKLAINYYKKMLDSATKISDLPKTELGSCFYSLAETLKDDSNFDEAVKYFEKELELCTSLKDSLNSLSKIADTKEEGGQSVEEISEIYKKAIDLCKQDGNVHEEGRMQKRFVTYLRRAGEHTEAYKQELILADLNFVSSDTDAESSEKDTQATDDDVDIDEIIDELANSKRRSKNFKVTKNLKGETKLHTACIKGNLNVVQHLLDQGHPVNIRDNAGWLPLHEACSCGHLDIVGILVAKGAHINDRGGEECSGITPLHDAAVNGFLDIVQLLLDKGADATVLTENQESVLDYLEKWKGEQNGLSAADAELYEKLARRIKSVLEKAAVIKTNKEVVPRSANALVSPSKDYRRSSRFGLDDEENEELVAATPTSRTTDEYRNLMEGLRRKNSPQVSTSVKNKRSALISEEEIVDDDWLEDDVKRSTKKARMSTSPKKISPRPSFQEIIPIDDDEFEDIADFAFDDFESTPSTSTVCRKRKNQISLISAGFSRYKSSPEKQQRSQNVPISMNRKRKQQMKLTNLGYVEADSTCPNLILATPSNSFDSTHSSTSVQKQTSPSFEKLLAIDVRIEGKLFRVPIPSAQLNTLTIKWLAEEAATRYARKEYLIPVLELETKSGAILSDDDPLSLLFSMGETKAEDVEGKIIKWNVPPIRDRYKEASQSLNTEINEKIVQALESLSINLNLHNMGIKPVYLSPLCKALNRQTNLLELNLSGNFLSSEAIQYLAPSLNSLTNLYKLHLSCVNLTSEHLQILSNNLSESGLKKIIDLDLSDNFLRDDCFESLVTLTNSMKLKVLNISMNEFTKHLFQVANNKYLSLNIMDLEEFDVSDNKFDGESLCKILSWLNPLNLKSLNISRNAVGYGFLNEFAAVWSIQNNGLKCLKVSRCNIGDSDLHDFLIQCKKLQEIDLSYNEDLTSITLKCLFENRSLEKVNLIGCSNLLVHFMDFAKFVTTDEFGKKSLKISMKTDQINEDSKRNCEYLMNMWREFYGDKVIIRNDHQNILFLSCS